jgi:hypothetical protein
VFDFSGRKLYVIMEAGVGLSGELQHTILLLLLLLLLLRCSS